MHSYDGLRAGLLTQILQISSEEDTYYIGLRRPRKDCCDLLLCRVTGEGRYEWSVCNKGIFVPFAESSEEDGNLLHVALEDEGNIF